MRKLLGGCVDACCASAIGFFLQRDRITSTMVTMSIDKQHWCLVDPMTQCTDTVGSQPGRYPSRRNVRHELSDIQPER